MLSDLTSAIPSSSPTLNPLFVVDTFAVGLAGHVLLVIRTRIHSPVGLFKSDGSHIYT